MNKKLKYIREYHMYILQYKANLPDKDFSFYSITLSLVVPCYYYIMMIL